MHLELTPAPGTWLQEEYIQRNLFTVGCLTWKSQSLHLLPGNPQLVEEGVLFRVSDLDLIPKSQGLVGRCSFLLGGVPPSTMVSTPGIMTLPDLFHLLTFPITFALNLGPVYNSAILFFPL